MSQMKKFHRVEFKSRICEKKKRKIYSYIFSSIKLENYKEIEAKIEIILLLRHEYMFVFYWHLNTIFGTSRRIRKCNKIWPETNFLTNHLLIFWKMFCVSITINIFFNQCRIFSFKHVFWTFLFIFAWYDINLWYNSFSRSHFLEYHGTNIECHIFLSKFSIFKYNCLRFRSYLLKKF